MKKLLSILVLMSTLNSFAAPMEQGKLNNINAFIQGMISSQVGTNDISVKISSAEVDESSDLITALNFSASYTAIPSLVLEAGLATTKTAIEIKGSAFVDLSELPGVEKEQINDEVEMNKAVEEAIADLEADGNLKAVATTKFTKNLKEINIIITPTANSAYKILNSAKVLVSVKNDTELTIALSGSFDGSSSDVQAIRGALSGILGSLGNNRFPEETDLNVLSTVIENILNESNL